ncbi:unnamed protein product [Oppiella nova]|uniref:Uncharacterized protein n=1 Tax=Oppiella nova TaxID=334625 RepID=A0A7R9MAK9_9ACAR|nr:unnamed protein product [Oppiella nova]CAG2173829.1 unnamed protein product [Oppiella nova]
MSNRRQWISKAEDVTDETVAYGDVWEPYRWPLTTSLCGALLLLLAECQTEAPTLLAGVPSDGHNRPKVYMLCTGRILTLLIFVTSLSQDLRDEENVLLIIRRIIVVVLVVAVTIGYKTKLSALLLVVWLTVINSYYNCFWAIDSNKSLFYIRIKSFFYTLSVIGGTTLMYM